MSDHERSKPPSIFDLMAAARRYRAGGPGPKVTLCAFIERMGEYDGEWLCWPKMDVLAFETEQDVGTVRRHLAIFESLGLVKRRTRGREGGGRGSNYLVLNLPMLLGITSESKPRIVRGLGGANRASEGGQTAHSGPFSGSVPLIEVPEEVPTRAPRAKRASPVPVDFPVSPAMRIWASHKFPSHSLDLDQQTELFLDYHRARGNTMKDWHAAWRTWITRAVAYAKERPDKRTSGLDAVRQYAQEEGLL